MHQYFLNKTQWLVGRDVIKVSSYPGLMPRVVISRSMCIYYFFDLSKVPSQKKGKALENKVRVSSPFYNYGFHVEWQKGYAQVWLWDNSALWGRLPEEARGKPVIPDSALSAMINEGERTLQGIDGFDVQHWSNGCLQDSRWAQHAESHAEAIRLSVANLRKNLYQGWLINVSGIFLLMLLLWSLLLQAGVFTNLTLKVSERELALEQTDDVVMLQQQARRRAMELRARLIARERLFPLYQSRFISQLVKNMPDTAIQWLRYDYRTERLELLVKDPGPDPREYVRKLNSIEGITNVQVQLDPNNQRVRLVSELGEEQK